MLAHNPLRNVHQCFAVHIMKINDAVIMDQYDSSIIHCHYLYRDVEFSIIILYRTHQFIIMVSDSSSNCHKTVQKQGICAWVTDVSRLQCVSKPNCFLRFSRSAVQGLGHFFPVQGEHILLYIYRKNIYVWLKVSFSSICYLSFRGWKLTYLSNPIGLLSF